MKCATFRQVARTAFASIAAVALFPVTMISAEAATPQYECTGEFKGMRPTEKELEQVLESHRKWLEIEDRSSDDSLRANLCEAKLFEANLTEANLREADLNGANLSQAKLIRANLSGADLSGAILSEAKLISADLSGANLSGANLSEAGLITANLSGTNLSWSNLIEAKLFKADLSGAILNRAVLKRAIMIETKLIRADLSAANLEGVNLSDADLSEATLFAADLSETTMTGARLFKADLSEANLHLADLSNADLYEADLNGANLREARLDNANLLETSLLGIVFDWRDYSLSGARRALMGLRKTYMDLGIRDKERSVTYVLHHRKTMDQLTDLKWEGLLNYLLFDLTTKWGMAPERALVSLLLLIPCFGVLYLIALWKPGADGVWQHWSSERCRTDLGTEKPALLRVRGVEKIFYALYFSLLSSLRVGWRELDAGSWICRIQPGEYALRASGWVRTVAGIQSLISIYLIAIWALTYFGRPFG
jgi:uncharacterized protein YjbI with pentapeptide repeats